MKRRRFGHGDLLAWAALTAVMIAVAGIIAGHVAELMGSVDVSSLVR